MICSKCKKEVPATYWSKLRMWWECKTCTDYLKKELKSVRKPKTF